MDFRVEPVDRQTAQGSAPSYSNKNVEQLMPLKRPTRLAFAVSLAGLAGMAQAENVTPNLQINGFATAGVTWIDNDFGETGRYYSDPFFDTGIEETPDPSHDTVLGLQITYALSDKFDMVGQLVSDARTDYHTALEWGYVAYRMNDNVRLRAGRFAAPYYMHSQSQRVGQAYPWARLPAELYYGLYQKSLDGFDLQYRQSLGENWRLDAQLYLGGAREVWGRSKNAHGINLNLSNNSLTLHAGYGQSVLDWDFTADPYGNSLARGEFLQRQFGGGYSTPDNDAHFVNAGFTFDNGEWLAIGEFGQLDIDGWGPSWNAGYLTVGHYFGKWLPYVSANKLDSYNVTECHAHFAQTEAAAGALVTQLQTDAATAAAAAAQATATAANQLAASDFAGYAASIATATAQSLQADALITQLVLQTAGLGPNVVNSLALTRNTTCNGGAAGGEQTSYTLGFRYDATKNVSVKLQLDRVVDFGDGNGLMAVPDPTQHPDDDLNVFTFNVNAAF